MSCFIIAEAGVNHNGSLDLALKLVDAAVAAGADAVKFQTFTAETLVTAHAKKADYQKKTTGDTSQFEMLQALELSVAAHEKIRDHCQSHHIEFMSTGFDQDSIDFLCQLGVKRLKIPSGEITHLQLLAHAASKALPLIISTGMSTLNEVAKAMTVLIEKKQNLDDVTLLHCTSNYPTAFSNVNLAAMQTLANHFNLPVGYSDHTPGIMVAPLAVAMGAKIIEKHLTLDRNLPGPDQSSSLEPSEFAAMVEQIRQTEIILGNPAKLPCQSELAVRDLVRRSVVLRYDTSAETILTKNHLVLLRPGTGIAPEYLNQFIGRRLVRNLSAGTLLTWEDV